MVNLLPPPPPAADPPPAPLSPEALRLLRERLEQVRAHWSRRPPDLRPVARLRSPVLEPDLEEEATLAGLEAALQRLTRRRAEWLAGQFGPDLRDPPHGEGAPEGRAVEGRLLVCEINMSLGRGEAEVHSGGYFDVDDRPPWDHWLVCFGRTRPSQPDEPVECLLVWVPHELEPLARAGVEANAGQCLYWVGERDEGLARQLAEEMSGRSGP